MKDSLREKVLYRGRLARELKGSEAYTHAQEKCGEKIEQLLKEAISSKTIEELRYNAGFIDGLKYLGNLVDQWSQREEALKRK